MSKKFLSVIALLMAAVMLLCACGQEAEPKDESKDPTKATTQTDPTQSPEPEETDPTEPEGDDTTEPPVDEPTDRLYMSAAKAQYGASTLNGYGIWSEYRGLSTSKTVCVNAQGYKTFEVEGTETDATGVYNDAVIMKVNYDYYVLRSAVDGTMLFDSSANDGAKIILPEHAGKKMFQDGYIMVMKANESYNGVSYEIGFMDSKGRWIQELSADNALLKHLNEDYNLKYMQKEIVYMGQGMLGILCADNEYRYYNIFTNTCVKVDSDVGVTFYTLLDELEYGVYFQEGVSEPVYMSNNYYLFYTNGKIEPYKVLWPTGMPRADKCGNPYFDRATKTAYFLYSYDGGMLIANQNGDILKKHEGVHLREYSYLTANRSGRSGFEDDGYARIIIENQAETRYYAMLNYQGEFLFEPVQLDAQIDRVFDLDGYHIDADGLGYSGYFAVINQDGTVCYSSEYVMDFSVKNGVMHFTEDDEEYYINIQTPALY